MREYRKNNENICKEILETFNQNIETYYAKPRKSGKRQLMRKLNENYKSYIINKIEKWLAPIIKEFGNLRFKFQIGQPYNLSGFIWIRIYQGNKGIKGTKGHYCGISFDFNNDSIKMWSGFGMTGMSSEEIERIKGKYIEEYKNIINDNKFGNRFQIEEEYGDATMLCKVYKHEEIINENLETDLRYLLGIYSKCESNERLYSIRNNQENKEEHNVENFKKSTKISGRNILYKGFPGTGKSTEIKRKYLDNLNEMQYERVVFYPEYTNADFIGTIRPTVKDYSPVYEFFPGPLTIMLKRAIKNPETNFFLIIEEINRGDAEAIFGDVFQLLDREDEDGKSEFPITNEFIANEVFGDKSKKVYLPRNLSIIATMNVSDENVKNIDTAFERRWETIWFLNNKGEYDDKVLKGMGDITWGKFRNIINNKICSQQGIMKNEDKQLGPYFINSKFVVDTDENNNLGRDKLLNKVIMYLYTKVCKYEKTLIFSENIQTISQLYSMFLSDKYLDVFNEDIKKELLSKINS